MWSDLTLGPSSKVKRWFTGFGELSFRWIQICISSQMRRSSLKFISELMSACCLVSDLLIYQLTQPLGALAVISISST